ncbi:hypothetical protein GCM10027035_18040 [Emticicia sediminis]
MRAVGSFPQIIINQMKKFSILVILLFLLNSCFSHAQTIEEIFQNCEDTYEKTEFYLDSGKVVQEFYENSHPFENAKLFKTAFSKKGMFSFEYYEVGKSNSLYTIVCDSSLSTKSWWGIIDKIETEKSIEEHLSAARGVSSQTSTYIPELLYPNKNILGVSIFKNLTNQTLQTSENVNGSSCFKISGQELDGSEITIWISKSNFLIKKIITDRKVKDFKVKSTYEFFSEMPNFINNKIFVFRPNRKVKL